MRWNGEQTEVGCAGGFRRLVILQFACLLLGAMGLAYYAIFVVFASLFEILTSHIMFERMAQVALALVVLSTGIGSVLLVKTFASDDERQLIEFLEETIEAELV